MTAATYASGMIVIVSSPDPRRGAWAKGMRGTIVAVNREGMCSVKFEDKRLYHAYPCELTRAPLLPRGKHARPVKGGSSYAE